jgi:sporulation-control protein spo0M
MPCRVENVYDNEVGSIIPLVNAICSRLASSCLGELNV